MECLTAPGPPYHVLRPRLNFSFRLALTLRRPSPGKVQSVPASTTTPMPRGFVCSALSRNGFILEFSLARDVAVLRPRLVHSSPDNSETPDSGHQLVHPVGNDGAKDLNGGWSR